MFRLAVQECKGLLASHGHERCDCTLEREITGGTMKAAVLIIVVFLVAFTVAQLDVQLFKEVNMIVQGGTR